MVWVSWVDNASTKSILLNREGESRRFWLTLWSGGIAITSTDPREPRVPGPVALACQRVPTFWQPGKATELID